MLNIKYYDTYPYGTSNSYTRATIGSATKETWQWYLDTNALVDNYGSWQIRVGNHSNDNGVGIFAFTNNTGEASPDVSFRTSIIPK